MPVLVYVMGASGCGKDSCLRYAKDRLPLDAPVAFAHRYITRPADSGGENHVALTPGEFNLRLSRGLFCLHWESHGLCYGVGREIETWLAVGLKVVLNGSREYFPRALARFPDLVPVEITAEAGAVAERLAARGRETPAQVEERMRRGASLRIKHPGLVRIDNSGPLPLAGEKMLDCLRS
jgi:ribose 1,5-bisphosphokinase